MDGAVLSAPYDPSETRAAPIRSSEPPPTEVIRAPAPPAETRTPLQSTIRAPVPQVPYLDTPKVDGEKAEQTVGVPLIFRLALGIRGILAVLSIIPWAFLRGGGLLWNMHALLAGVLSLIAGVALYVKCKRGLLLIADAVVAFIVAVAFFASSEWFYWTGTWPIVSGTMLIAAAIEMRKRVSQIWLLALAGLIFGLYTVAFYVILKTSFTGGSFAAIIYPRAATAFIYGVILAAFAFAARGRAIYSN